MKTEFDYMGYHVIITEGARPEDAQLQINDVVFPLQYHPGFKGWGVHHTVYGFLPSLEKLAQHIIISNPRLIIGHGDMPDHEGDPPHSGQADDSMPPHGDEHGDPHH